MRGDQEHACELNIEHSTLKTTKNRSFLGPACGIFHTAVNIKHVTRTICNKGKLKIETDRAEVDGVLQQSVMPGGGRAGG